MREKSQILSEFWIKILAILFMTIDHIGAFMVQSDWAVNFPSGSVGYNVGYVFRCVGRLAFPLFALMLAEGMRKSHDRGKYLCKILLVWVLITLVESVLYFGFSGRYRSLAMDEAFSDLLLEALFVFCLSLKGPKKLLSLLPLGVILLSFSCFTSEKLYGDGSLWSQYFPKFLRAPYSLYGLVIFLGFYYAYPLADWGIHKVLLETNTDLSEYQKSKEYRSLVNLVGLTIFFSATVIFWGISKAWPAGDYLQMSIETYCLLDILLIFLYNGKRGYDKKWFRYAEYAYYPMHLALLALIFSLIFH